MYLWQTVNMVVKRKVTLTLPEDVVRAYRITAARKDMSDSALVETALKSYLGLGALKAIQDKLSGLGLSPEEAEALAVREVKAVQRKRV